MKSAKESFFVIPCCYVAALDGIANKRASQLKLIACPNTNNCLILHVDL